jgi:hypothetical protein
MTAHIELQKTKRFKILLAMYEQSGQNQQFWCDVQQLASQQGIKNGDFETNYQYLIGEGLLKPYGAGFTAHITHRGIKEVEFTVSNPTEPSSEFPSYKTMGF